MMSAPWCEIVRLCLFHKTVQKRERQTYRRRWTQTLSYRSLSGAGDRIRRALPRCRISLAFASNEWRRKESRELGQHTEVRAYTNVRNHEGILTPRGNASFWSMNPILQLGSTGRHLLLVSAASMHAKWARASSWNPSGSAFHSS